MAQHTPYGDSVPLVAACGIKRNIFIVEKIGNGYDIKCIDSSGETANEKHPVLIYKHDDHYDTIERILSDDNDDNDDDDGDKDDDDDDKSLKDLSAYKYVEMNTEWDNNYTTNGKRKSKNISVSGE